MNWDSIKYIFQIPLDWYKKIHKRVFNAYGTNFITVREGFYGGTEVGVDSDGFAAEVERAIDLSDYVKTVNEIGPDENGDVDLGDIVHSVNNQTPDSNGNVDLGDIVHSVNGETPDSNGEVTVDTGVMTINGTSPTSGDIVLNYLDQDDWANASSLHSVCPYIYSNTAYVNGTIPQAVTNIYSYTGMLQYQDLDSYITALGYLKNADLSDYVLESDLTTTLADYVLSSDLTTTLADYVLSSDLTTILADYVQESDLGDLAFLDKVTVDGHQSDSNGEVDFGLTASKWMKTDANGHISTTNDEPVTVSSQQDGYLYATNGQLTYKDDEYVTLDTTQTITAAKTFMGSGVDVNITAGGQLSVTTSSSASALSAGALVLEQSVGAFLDIGPTTNYTQLINLGGAYGFQISDPYAINLNAPANKATLQNHPTETTTASKAIATVGYVQDKCITIDKTQYTPVTNNNLKVVTGVTWNGTQIAVASQTWNFKNGVLVSTTNNNTTYIDTVPFSPT